LFLFYALLSNFASLPNHNKHTQKSTIQGPKVVVRPEEAAIVIFVLVLWVGAIALFFNRWGKIRMLEPYQPKFQQEHRVSCPLIDLDTLSPVNHRASIAKMSMGMSTMPSTYGFPRRKFEKTAFGNLQVYVIMYLSRSLRGRTLPPPPKFRVCRRSNLLTTPTSAENPFGLRHPFDDPERG
jgi:Domain of unknown function (DUF4808)